MIKADRLIALRRHAASAVHVLPEDLEEALFFIEELRKQATYINGGVAAAAVLFAREEREQVEAVFDRVNRDEPMAQVLQLVR